MPGSFSPFQCTYPPIQRWAFAIGAILFGEFTIGVFLISGFDPIAPGKDAENFIGVCCVAGILAVIGVMQVWMFYVFSFSFAVDEKQIVQIDPLGKETCISWADVSNVITRGQSITIFGRDGKKIKVGTSAGSIRDLLRVVVDWSSAQVAERNQSNWSLGQTQLKLPITYWRPKGQIALRIVAFLFMQAIATLMLILAVAIAQKNFGLGIFIGIVGIVMTACACLMLATWHSLKIEKDRFVLKYLFRNKPFFLKDILSADLGIHEIRWRRHTPTINIVLIVRIRDQKPFTLLAIQGGVSALHRDLTTAMAQENRE